MLTTADKLSYLLGLKKCEQSAPVAGVSSVNGKTGEVLVREVPQHGIIGQVLTVTGSERYDWKSLPVWNGQID